MLRWLLGRSKNDEADLREENEELRKSLLETERERQKEVVENTHLMKLVRAATVQAGGVLSISPASMEYADHSLVEIELSSDGSVLLEISPGQW